MDKNSVIGLVLIGLLLIGYTMYQQPNDEEIAQQRRINDSLATVSAQKDMDRQVETFKSNDLAVAPDTTAEDSASTALRNSALTAKYGALSGAVEGEEVEKIVENEHLRLTFSNKGGSLVRAELKQFNTYDSLPLVLFDEENQKFGFEFVYPSLGKFNSSDFYFTSSTGKPSVSGEETTQITYTLALDGGRKIENIYTVTGNTYDVGYETRFNDVSGIITEPKLIWELSARHIEKGIESERNKSSIFYKEQDSGRDYLSETGSDDAVVDEAPLEWVAFKQNFFSTILIGNQPFGKGAELESHPYEEENDSLTQFYSAIIPLNADGQAFSGRLFIGPNDYRVLKDYGYEIDKVINLGWGIFGWVNKYLVITIFDWLEHTGLSYGIIILILTLIIKMILMPLTWKNYLSSAKMRVLKPEIDVLNEKNKDADPMKKQQATMELYRKTGVSPFAGCLPMLIQLPILYAMFQFFPSSIQLRHEPFLWADDLSAYDSIASLPFTIPFYGDHVSLFTLLMCVSTLIYTVYNSNNMPTQTQPGMPNMKVIMYIFPFMMLFFFNQFASGLSYYYFLANVISIFQMILIKRFFIDEEKIKLQIAENKKKKAKLGKSRFQQKLEDMAKQRGLNAK